MPGICAHGAVALVTVLLGAATGEAAAPSESCAAGARYLTCGNYTAAITLLDGAVAKGPPDKGVLRCRGFARLLSGDPKGAIDDFAKAIELDPKDPVLYYGRGSAYSLLGNRQKAISDLGETLHLDPGYSEASTARLLLLADTGDSEEFLAEAERPLATTAPAVARGLLGKRVDLETFLVYNAWSDLFFEYQYLLAWRRDAEARRQTSAGATDAPDSKWLAVVDATQRRLSQSISRLNQTIERDPKDWMAYRLRGLVHVVSGDLKAALTDITKAIEIQPHPDLYERRSEIYAELGDAEKSRADATKSRQLAEDALRHLRPHDSSFRLRRRPPSQ